MITKTKNFFSEVRAELGKASWPWESKDKGIRRYKELTDSTMVVIINFIHFLPPLPLYASGPRSQRSVVRRARVVRAGEQGPRQHRETRQDRGNGRCHFRSVGSDGARFRNQ